MRTPIQLFICSFDINGVSQNKVENSNKRLTAINTKPDEINIQETLYRVRRIRLTAAIAAPNWKSMESKSAT